MVTKEQLQEIHNYFDWCINDVWYNSKISTDAALGMQRAYRDSMLKICPLIKCPYYKPIIKDDAE